MKLAEVTTNLNALTHENDRFRKQLNDFYNSQRRDIEGKVRAILTGDRCIRENENAIVSLVMSMESSFKAIVISGNVTPPLDGLPTRRTLFLSGHRSFSENINEISNLQDFSSITRVRIDTERVCSLEKMEDIGTAVTSFYKVLQTFDMVIMPLSDQHPVGNEAFVHILFDGMFDMDFLHSHPGLENADIEFVRVKHKNVYIFGQNGAGKSTWANIITALQSGPRFEVGDAVRTTVTPTHQDVGQDDWQDNSFRLWDLPGVGDPEDYGTIMERHVEDTIHSNTRYSAVIFIFNGKTHPNDTVRRFLRAAEDFFGPSVRQSFIAIVNKFDENTERKAESYFKLLYDRGFKLTKKSMYTLGIEEDIHKYQEIRDVLSSFPARFVWKHQSKINKLYEKHKGDVNKILRELDTICKNKLDKFMENARVSTMVNESEWFFGRDGEEPKSIKIRTHRLRTVGIRKEHKYEDTVIKLDETTRTGTLSTLALQRTWWYEQGNIFFEGILKRPDNILIYSSDPKFDYVLFSINLLTKEGKESILHKHLGIPSNQYDFVGESSQVRDRRSFHL